MNERIDRLIKAARSGEIFPKTVTVEYDEFDLKLAEPLRIACSCKVWFSCGTQKVCRMTSREDIPMILKFELNQQELAALSLAEGEEVLYAVPYDSDLSGKFITNAYTVVTNKRLVLLHNAEKEKESKSFRIFKVSVLKNFTVNYTPVSKKKIRTRSLPAVP